MGCNSKRSTLRLQLAQPKRHVNSRKFLNYHISREILAKVTKAHHKFEADSLSVQWEIVFISICLKFSIFDIYLYILL